MSNRNKKLKRYHEYLNQKPCGSETRVHGFMSYRCNSCGEEWKMYLQEGIEEFATNHKPSPFMIRCRCGGMAQDASGLVSLVVICR